MHTSSFATLFTLAVAVSSAAAKQTYLRASDNSSFAGWYMGMDDTYTLIAYSNFKDDYGSEVVINNDTTITIGGMWPCLDGDAAYVDQGLGPSDLTRFRRSSAYDSSPSPGFSWAENGTLLLDNDKYHGWVHCQGPEFSMENGLYLAGNPIHDLPSKCKQIELVKYVH